MPAIGPSNALYPISQVKMYAPISLTSRHGMISTPIAQVSNPPGPEADPFRGEMLENPLAGLTTLAARFVESVAISSANIEIDNHHRRAQPFPQVSTGSQIALP